METIYPYVVFVHIAFGLISLITYWIAALARKGSPRHLKVGKVFMMAMIGIVITSVPIAITIYTRGKQAIALFLIFLVLITATGLWTAWRAVKYKHDQVAFRTGASYMPVAVLNLIVALIVLYVGITTSRMLLTGFSFVGIYAGVQMLARRRWPMTSPRWWLKEHFTSMVGSGVATHVAFLSIGVDRLYRAIEVVPPDWYYLAVWFVPTLLAMCFLVWLNRKYLPRKTGGAAVMSRA